MTAAGPQPVLALRHVEKRFPGVHALKDISIEIRPNEIVGLVGENGAGKSSLMRILAGVYQPNSGEILLNGRPVRIEGAADAMRQGIGMVFQEQSLLPNLTVGENIYLGNEAQFKRFGLIDWRRLNEAAQRQLAKVQVEVDPRTRAADLDFATRQMVELAKALTLEEATTGHIVVLLDEPTSVLDRAEIEVLFTRVRSLRQRASFVFVSHRMDEVLELSDRLYVMKDGAVTGEFVASEADAASLHRLMVGRGIQSEYYREGRQRPFRQEPALTVEDLALDGHYTGVNFTLHKGEILGIAGIVGSGREELTRTLAGLAPHDSGRIKVDGAEQRLSTPSAAVACGIGYVPRERRVEGLVLFLSVAANMTLASLASLTTGGLIHRGKERQLAEDWVKRLNIRTPGIDTLCLNLSGGNQQKVVLAKWLNAEAKILILDHPTRGLDVGAKEEVYELIRSVTERGISVILTADTLEETIGLSHTILVMRDGVVSHATDAPPGRKPQQVDLVQYMV